MFRLLSIFQLVIAFAISSCFVIYENHVSPYTTKITNVSNVFLTSMGSNRMVCLKVTEFILSPENANLGCQEEYIMVITSYNISSDGNPPFATGYLPEGGGLLQTQQINGKDCKKIKR